MLKTHNCNELNVTHIGQEITLAGWVNRWRDHGGLAFIDLRDRSGIVQVVANPDAPDAHATLQQARGEYAIGEGVTGNVVQTGIPEVIPDLSEDPRFLDRTVTRRTDLASPIAFICVPLKVDDDIVGALSVDRPFAVEAMLDKDLRLLLIVRF